MVRCVLSAVYIAFSPSPPLVSAFGYRSSPIPYQPSSSHTTHSAFLRAINSIARTAMRYWLMKAEPDSRIVKGKDVKVQTGAAHSQVSNSHFSVITHGHMALQFSVDDFQSTKTTPWEGVRNAEARNLMKEMRVGDKVPRMTTSCPS